MKKFHFKLQTVLNEKEKTEKLRLKEWSIVNKMFQDLVEEKNKLEHRLEKSISEMTELKQVNTTLAGHHSEMESFIHGLKLRIEWKKQEISRASKFVERKKQEWVFASQKRKILDKLKETQYQEFCKELKKYENKKLDELYIMRASHLKHDEES